MKKIIVRQIYIKPGVSFPFSTRMQRWLTDELVRLTGATEIEAGYSLVINVSADLGIEDNKVLGPTRFKRDKTIEYTLFLPFEAIRAAPDSRRAASTFLTNGIRSVLHDAGIEAPELDKESDRIVEGFATQPMMLDEAWPQ